MSFLTAALRWLLARAAVLLIGLALVGRARDWWRQRARHATGWRRAEREMLRSIYDLHDGVSTASRRRLGVRSVPVDLIVGTLRNPSQNTADFLPLPQLRGENWRGRWQRINRAMDKLATLPPIDLVKVGDEYFVTDGHNRVAAALRAGVVEMDADVTELIRPGEHVSRPALPTGTGLVGADEIISAASGRHSRTSPQRPRADTLTRRELLTASEPKVAPSADTSPDASHEQPSAESE